MSCVICGSDSAYSFCDYDCCQECHHMTSKKSEQHFIINDPLDKSQFEKMDVRDRFQQHTANICAQEKNFLLDVGCGPGRFLNFSKNKYKKILGLEITPECLDFLKSQLHINAISDLSQNDDNDPFSLVTAWHSLEHIPFESLTKILRQIAERSSNFTRFIVCVPNGSSWQSSFFKNKWLYYDYPNHLHQFSEESLLKLMNQQGFSCEKKIFSFSYSFFGYLLSFSNLWVNYPNFIYYFLKRKSLNQLSFFNVSLQFVKSLSGLTFGFFPSLAMTCLDLLSTNKRGVITICFKKNHCNM